MKRKRTIREIDLRYKRILLRADFNVPVENEKVTDDWRIRATLPTIRFLLSQACRITICSHLGRPKGKRDLKYTLKSVAVRLGELLGRRVAFADDCVSEDALRLSQSLEVGEILLLENTRFHPEETQNDRDFARRLSRFGEFFVDDAFAVAHRAHASNVGVARILPSAEGLLMENEVDVLSTALDHFKRPFVAIFGGVKISDKLDAIKRIGLLSDFILLGGGIANTAFKAQGLEVGDSLVEESALASVSEMLKEFGEKIILPVDAVVRSQNGEIETLKIDGVLAHSQILDVGSKTVEKFLGILKDAGEVIWNGPLGYFEKQPFDKGTLALVHGLSVLNAKIYVGGGDTDHALTKAGLREKVTHASTGGGAFIDFLAGKPLPGLEVLPECDQKAA